MSFPHRKSENEVWRIGEIGGEGGPSAEMNFSRERERRGEFCVSCGQLTVHELVKDE